MAKTTHVTPRANGWASIDGGNDRASRVFERKQEAIDWARDHSRREGSELYIHNRDGKIGSKDSHGNDPYPPKG